MNRTQVMRLFVALALPLASCGGGSGTGDTGPVASFSGAYHLGAVGVITDGGAANTSSAWGIASPDGMGNVPLSRFENGDGAILGPIADANNGYTLTGAGAMTWHALVAPGTPILRGALSADNNKAILCQIEVGEKPLIAAFLRRSGVHTNASLSGEYHMGQFWTVDNAMPPMTTSLTGSTTFDGVGAGTWGATQNANGIVTSFGSEPMTYAIAADGSATATYFEPLAGGVIEDGSLAVFTGSTSVASTQRLCVLVRKTMGASNALFAGNYTVVLIEGESGTHRSSVSALTSDGAGTISLGNGTTNDDGVITPTGPEPGGTYTVNAEGQFTVTTSSGQTLVGGISADGTFAFVAGSTTDGQHPLLALLMR